MSIFSSFWNVFKAIKKSYLLYGGILLGFIAWMFFLDTHSFNIHTELNDEIKALELEQDALTKIIKDDKYAIEQLQNEDSLEHFARERYGHKKKNETIFIIELPDTVYNK